MDLSNEFEPTPNNNTRLQRGIVTGWPPSDEPKWIMPDTYFDDLKMIRNWYGQFETCPSSGQLHFHIYVEFEHALRPRFERLRQIFQSKLDKPVSFSRSKFRSSAKSVQSCINYVTDPSKRKNGTECYIWENNKSKRMFFEDLKPKSKDKTETIVKYIDSKPSHWTWDQIVHENEHSKILLASCSWGSKYHNGRYASSERRTIQNVIVFYGAGGTGKTTMAQTYDIKQDEHFEERYFKRNPSDGKFWGGGRTAYRNQRIIHLEEFCGQETCQLFKEICDLEKHGPNVNIKNSGVQLNHETVIITSNHHPAAWYRHLWEKEPKQWMPVCRRFTQVWFFPQFREDGSPNTPSANTEPYFEDQTEQFKQFVSNYSEAVEHAAYVWPLPEKETQTFGP
jgi:hypothetical protein